MKDVVGLGEVEELAPPHAAERRATVTKAVRFAHIPAAVRLHNDDTAIRSSDTPAINGENP